MFKNSKILQFREQDLPLLLSLVIIVIPVIFLCTLCIPVQKVFAQQANNQGYDESKSSVALQEPTNSADNSPRHKKVICSNIIREDYNGLKLSSPSKIFFDPVKKEIYVIDSGHHRILVYTHDYYPLLSIGKSDGICTPLGLTVDPNGYLYVAQGRDKKHRAARISVYDPILRWKKDIYFKGFEGSEDFSPKNIAINNEGKLYLAGSGRPGVVVLNKDGTFSHILTPTDSLGKSDEEKASICDVVIAQDKKIYLLSEMMGRVYVYDKNENFLFKFGQKGGGSGKLSRPRGMAVDNDNKRIYIVDYMRHTVNVYSLEGHFLFEFGGLGWSKGWFQYPSDISIDMSGKVLVADTFNNRVQVFVLK